MNVWTVNGKEVINQCKNVYGSGYCIESLASGASPTTYTVSSTVTATPTAYVAPAKPEWAVEGYGTTVAIPVYTPAVLWPVASSSVPTSSAVPTSNVA